MDRTSQFLEQPLNRRAPFYASSQVAREHHLLGAATRRESAIQQEQPRDWRAPCERSSQATREHQGFRAATQKESARDSEQPRRVRAPADMSSHPKGERQGLRPPFCKNNHKNGEHHVTRAANSQESTSRLEQPSCGRAPHQLSSPAAI